MKVKIETRIMVVLTKTKCPQKHKCNIFEDPIVKVILGGSKNEFKLTT